MSSPDDGVGSTGPVTARPRGVADRVAGVSATVGLVEADEADLAAEHEAGRLRDRRADVLDDRQHVAGRAALGRLDEVGVLVAHVRGADAQPAQAETVDQLARGHLAGHRVDEHRPGVLAARLVLAAPADDLLQLGRRRRGVAVAQLQRGREHDLVVGEVGPAEPQPQPVRGDDAAPAPVQIEQVDVDEARRHVGAVPAGVHPHTAADGSRHADGPLEPGEPPRHRPPGEDRQRDRAAGDDDVTRVAA